MSHTGRNDLYYQIFHVVGPRWLNVSQTFILFFYIEHYESIELLVNGDNG